MSSKPPRLELESIREREQSVEAKIGEIATFGGSLLSACEGRKDSRAKKGD